MRYCNRCKKPVTASENPEYEYRCLNCDEDLFSSETYVDYSISEVVFGNMEDYMEYHHMSRDDLTETDYRVILHNTIGDLREYADEVVEDIMNKGFYPITRR